MLNTVPRPPSIDVHVVSLIIVRDTRKSRRTAEVRELHSEFRVVWRAGHLYKRYHSDKYFS